MSDSNNAAEAAPQQQESYSEPELVNDAITSEDAGFGDAGEQTISEEQSNEEGSEENLEAQEGENPEGVQAETTEELKDEIQDAVENGATEEDVQDMIKEFELKVNGKTMKKKIDLSDEEAIKKELQLAAAGRNAMQRSKELENLYKQELQRLKDDPFSVLEELGLDSVELSKSRLQKEVEELQKDPAQRELEKIRAELQKERQRAQELKQRQEQQEYEKLLNEEHDKLQNEIEGALDSHTSLPNDPYTVKRIAETMFWAVENADKLGLDPSEIGVQDIIPTVEAEIKNEMKRFMSSVPDEMFEEYIDKQRLEKMRKKRIEGQAKAKPAQPLNSSIKATANNTKTEEDKPKRKISSKEFFRNL